MEVDFSQKLIGYDGKPVKSRDEETSTDAEGKEVRKVVEKEIDLKTVCINSLMFFDQRENLTGDDKFRRHRLANKIYESAKEKKAVTIAAENIVLLKQQIAKVYSPLVVGPAFEILDPEGSKEK